MLRCLIISVFAGLVAANAFSQAECKVFDKQGKPKCAHATSFANCPRKGSGGDPKLNSAKNRTTAPSAAAVTETTISEIVKAVAKGPKKWKSNASRAPLRKLIEGKPFRVTLFMKKVTHYTDGAESCNCNLDGERNNDFHIVLVTKKSDAEKRSLTAEITPRVRPDGWTFAKLMKLADENAYVRVTGWALLDTQHVGKPVPVRRTHWEIHPVTRFEVCTTSKADCDAGTGWTALEDVTEP